MPAAISLATAADAEEVAALLRATTLHYWGSAPPLEEYRAVAAGLLDPEGDCELALATVEGRTAGFATFALVYPGPAASGQLYMKELFVLEPFRGRRVGEELLRFLAGIARARGCSRLDWTTETGNQGAMRFYERLGAARVPEKVYYRLEGEALAALTRSG